MATRRALTCLSPQFAGRLATAALRLEKRLQPLTGDDAELDASAEVLEEAGFVETYVNKEGKGTLHLTVDAEGIERQLAMSSGTSRTRSWPRWSSARGTTASQLCHDLVMVNVAVTTIPSSGCVRGSRVRHALGLVGLDR